METLVSRTKLNANIYEFCFAVFELSTCAISFVEEEVEVSKVDADPIVEWTIEFAKHLDEGPIDSENQILFLKMNGKDHRYKTVVADPIVDITMGRSKYVHIVVENLVRQKWYRIELLVQCFGPSINVNWFARGKISVISMGFFPDHVIVEKIKNNEFFMFPTEFIQGFWYVRKYISLGNLDAPIPVTWQACDSIDGHILKMGKFLVFGTEKTLDEIEPEEEEEGEQVEEVDAEALKALLQVDPTPVSKKRIAQGAPTSRAKKRAGKETTTIKKEKPAPKPRAPRKEKAPASRRVFKGPSTAKHPGAAKLLSSNTRASSTWLVVHLSDDEDIEAPKETKIMEGREVLQIMEKYYTFGIKTLFSIPVECILPAPARLCYKMLNKEHVK
ncbi:unnamed protein product [Calypogeia fissa]